MWSNKIIRYSIITVLSLVVLVYLAFVLTSIDVFYPGTIINGKDYGLKSPAYVENQMYENPADFKFEIKFRDKTEVISGERIGYRIDYRSYLDEIKREQNPFLWVTTFWNKPYTIDRYIIVDYKLLSSELDLLSELDESKMVEPENPKIEVNKDSEVVAVDYCPGTRIDNVEGLKNQIFELIKSGGTSIDVAEEGYYAEAEYKVDSDRVVRCLERCNKIVSLNITYQYGDYEVALTPEQLFSTIRIADNYNTLVSKEKVGAVVESFSRLHDTYNRPRTFKTHSGKKITINNGDYGWQIDCENETIALYNNIIHYDNVTRTPTFEVSGYTYDEDKDDVGDFYAEVDIENQHMYLVKNGRTIMDSDVVTGNVYLRRATPTGIYSVDYKQSPSVLRGEDYESKVTYWMPFNGGVGFHDATWRGSFGGQIYLGGGSHGCVNMPFSKAQELYGYIEEGMPVIVY